MAPATEAVIGAVPAAKSGVASATNTVARMISGALGVAVIGSLVSSLYSNDLKGSSGTLPQTHRRPRRIRLGPLLRSPPSCRRRRQSSCLPRPATRSQRRWEPASWSRRHSPLPRRWSCFGTCPPANRLRRRKRRSPACAHSPIRARQREGLRAVPDRVGLKSDFNQRGVAFGNPSRVGQRRKARRLHT
jgi:hypothetical protein